MVGATSKNAGISLLLAGLFGLAGYLAGGQRQTVKAIYQAHRPDPFGQWQFIQLSPQPAGFQQQPAY